MKPEQTRAFAHVARPRWSQWQMALEQLYLLDQDMDVGMLLDAAILTLEIANFSMWKSGLVE